MDFIKLENFSNVASGGLATVELPAGSRGYAYHSVLLQIKHNNAVLMTQAEMLTKIRAIKVIISGAGHNNDRIIELSAKSLLMLNKFYKLSGKDGLLPLYFAAPYWDNPQNESRFKLGTSDLSNVHVQVQLTSDTVTPQITGQAYVYPQNESLGRFIRLEEHVRDNNETGRIQISDLPIQGGGFGLKAVHIDTAAIDEITLKDGTVPFYEDEPFYRSTLLKINAHRTNGRAQQTDYTHIDLGGNNYGRIKDTANMGRFVMELDRTAAGAFTILTEVVVGRDIPLTQL